MCLQLWHKPRDRIPRPRAICAIRLHEGEMSIAPLPTPLQHLGGRRFSFYPPIRNLEPNECCTGG